MLRDFLRYYLNNLSVSYKYHLLTLAVVKVIFNSSHEEPS